MFFICNWNSDKILIFFFSCLRETLPVLSFWTPTVLFINKQNKTLFTFRAVDFPISNFTPSITASVYMVTGLVIKAMAAWCATVNTEKSIVTFLKKNWDFLLKIQSKIRWTWLCAFFFSRSRSYKVITFFWPVFLYNINIY